MSDPTEQPEPQEVEVELDPVQLAHLQQRLHSEQNLVLGAAAGTAAAAAGAAAWAAITIATDYQIGFMAIAVGFLVGHAIRFAGKGVSNIFGVMGGVLALLGCALGNLLAVTALVAGRDGVPLLEALAQLDPQLIQELMVAFFSPMDLLFYGIAVYEGYRLSFRQLSSRELERMTKGGGVA